MDRNKVQFRFIPRIRLIDHGEYKKEIRISMRDRNDLSDKASFHTCSFTNMESIPTEFLLEVIQDQLIDILNTMANEKQNMHYEPELHRECERPWSFK